MIILTQEILQQVADNNAFIVLVKSIAKRASFDQYQKSFPSLSTICKDTNLSKPTVIKSLKYLQDKNIIKITRSTKNQIKQVNNYTICTDKIKTIGNLKFDDFSENSSKGDLLGVVKEIDKGSKGDLLGVVKEIDINLKSNLTSSTINHIKKYIKKENQDLIENEFEKIYQDPKKFFSKFKVIPNNMEFNLDQAILTLNLLKDNLIEYYTVKKPKIEIKNISLTITNWIKKDLKLSDFCIYKSNQTKNQKIDPTKIWRPEDDEIYAEINRQAEERGRLLFS